MKLLLLPFRLTFRLIFGIIRSMIRYMILVSVTVLLFIYGMMWLFNEIMTTYSPVH